MNFFKQFKSGRSVIGRINGIIWMVGIFVLSYIGDWFPGIFYLIGLTVVINLAFMFISMATASKTEQSLDDFSPPVRADELETEPQPLAPEPEFSSNNNRMQRLDPEPIPPARTLSSEYRIDLLPDNCPNCGAPIGEKDVEMVGIKTAKCNFCKTDFSLGE